MMLNAAFGFLRKKMGWFYGNKSTVSGSSVDFFSPNVISNDFLRFIF